MFLFRIRANCVDRSLVGQLRRVEGDVKVDHHVLIQFDLDSEQRVNQKQNDPRC